MCILVLKLPFPLYYWRNIYREFKHEAKIILPLFRNYSTQLDSEIFRGSKTFGLLSLASANSKCWNRSWYSNILNINLALIKVNTLEGSKSWISKFKEKTMLKKKDNMYQYNHLFLLKLKRGEIIKGSSEVRGTRNIVFIF